MHLVMFLLFVKSSHFKSVDYPFKKPQLL